MLTIKEIDEEIKKLENKEYFNYDICNKLAILYVLKDHYKPHMETTKNSIDLNLTKSVK